MAYNPFDFFRKHQKVLFAVVTVIIMFVFVLQAGVSGGGDFFQAFPRWIAKFQTHGEPMAVIDGGTVKASQVADVGGDRGLANGYMLQANTRSLAAAAAKARKEANAATTEDLRKVLDRDVKQVDAYVAASRVPPELWPMLRADLSRLAATLGEQEKSTPKSEDAGRVKAVRVYAEAAVGEMNRRASGDRGESGVYFANQPNRTDRDRLEFLLWKKKADKLGIRYTDEDVVRLVDAEFPPDSISSADLKSLAAEVAAKAVKRPGELYEALADEFRVRAAQTAVLGVNAVRNPVAPAVGTARERYEHFVSETTATQYSMLAIPVEAFLSQVTGEPTEAELTKIFNEASNTDPDPGSSRPGVREPRKVGVQWIEVTGEEEYYKVLAAKRGEAFRQVQAAVAAKAVLGGTVPPARSAAEYDEYLSGQARVGVYRQTPGANPGRPVVGNLLRGAVGGGLAWDPNNAYSLSQELPKYPVPGYRQDQLTDAELFRPELAAALAGLTASALATNAPPLAPIAAVTETAFRHTREQRVVAGIRAFLVPTQGGAGVLADAVGGAVAVNAAATPPLPAAAVLPLLNKQTDDAMRTEVATAEVQEFQKELTRIMGQKLDGPRAADKTAQERAEREHKAKLAGQAAKYTKEWTDARQVKAGGTTEPRAVQALGDDAGLATLLQKDLTLTGYDGKPKNPRAAVGFGQAFVNESELGQSPEGGFRANFRPVSGLYVPRPYDPVGTRRMLQQFGGGQDYAPFAFMSQLSVSAGSPLLAFWRTAEVDPVRPLSLTSDKAARDKCVAIWKMNKARDLARQAANDAAREIGKDNPGEVQIKQRATDALKKLRDPFVTSPAFARFQEFDSVSQFTVAKTLIGPEEGPGNPPRAAPLFAFNPSHPAMPYEADKLRDELVAKKDSPVGTTFLVEDQPKTTLYLLVVAGLDQPNARDHLFVNHVLYPSGAQSAEDRGVLSAPGFAPLFGTYAAAADRKVAVALLKAEFGYKDENPKLDDKKE